MASQLTFPLIGKMLDEGCLPFLHHLSSLTFGCTHGCIEQRGGPGGGRSRHGKVLFLASALKAETKRAPSPADAAPASALLDVLLTAAVISVCAQMVHLLREGKILAPALSPLYAYCA